MKILLPLFLISFQVIAQSPVVIYHENFDLPSGADSVTTNYTLLNPNAPAASHLWNDTLMPSLSTGQVYHVYGQRYNTIYFETNTFSTIGANSYFLLEFDHIAKLYLANSAFIQVSLNGGSTWTDVQSSNYYGNSYLFKSNNYFNEGAYLIPSDLWQTGSNVIPQSNWWVRETFDLSNLIYDSQTNSGYSQVKLRFNAKFLLGSPGSTTTNQIFFAGWFVDNIKITAHTCELIPPTITFNVLNGFCLLKPEGKVTLQTLNTYEVGLKATDNTGYVNKVELIYSVNGGVEDTLIMSFMGNNIYKKNLINIFSGDIVNWYINAYDACNVKREPFKPGTYFTFEVDNTNYTKCGTINCISIPSLINTFPWYEDFEGPDWVIGATGLNRGMFPSMENWTLAPLATLMEFGWGITDSSYTIGTGPISNNSIGGEKFLYTEGGFTSPQSGTSYSMARITTPCIDLTNVTTDYVFEYYYHFFGSDITKFRIDIDTGAVSEKWWIQYKQVIGQTHSKTYDPWLKDIISLADFKGKIIKIRFIAFKDGPGDRADFALDDFAIYTPLLHDAGLEKRDVIPTNSCNLSNATDVSIRLRNYGADTILSLPVAYQINNNPVKRETASVNLATGDTALYTFNTKANFSNSGTYNIKVWTELSGDAYVYNDTLNVDVLKLPVHSSFPLSLNFESSVAAPDLVSTNGVLNNSAFLLNAKDNSSYNGNRWMIYNKPVKDDYMGPVGGSFRNGNYLLLNSGNYNSDVAEFKTTCLDFSSLTAPMLSFRYHNFNTNSIKVLVREVPSENWVEVFNTATSGNVMVKQHEYLYKLINLSAYAGSTVEIKWESRIGITKYSAIDDILIFDKQAVDLALVSEESRFYNSFNSSLPVQMNFRIANAGNHIFSTTTFFVKGKFIENCVANPQEYEFTSSITGFIPGPLLLTSYARTITYNSIPPAGNYTLKMWVEIAGDGNPINDTIVKNSIILDSRPGPYFNDFEACSDELIHQGKYRQWDRAQPTKSGTFNNAYSGSYVSMLSPDDILADATDYMLLPHFIGLDTLFNAELRFWHNYENSNGMAKVQYFSNNIWQDLPYAANAINWPQNIDVNGFTGNSNGWIQSRYPLSVLNLGKNSILSLSFFANGIDTGKGWMIDDLEIYIPMQNSSSPKNVIFNNTPMAGYNNISVNVKNTGAAPFNKVVINTSANGINNNNNYNFPKLEANKTVSIAMDSVNLISGTLNEFKIITSKPGNKSDQFPQDDTLNLSLFLPERVNILPYCTDFEQQVDFMAYNFNYGGIDTSWTYGMSNKTVMGGAYSGNNAWFTNKADYGILSDQYLLSPEISIKKDSCYHLSFFHQFITETNFDGGTVEFTLDDGISWQVLGSYGDTNWFNTPAIHSNGYKAGWSGNSSGWQKAEKLMRFFEDGKVQFRFYFSTNSSINMEGWMLDDFCFENSNQGCEMVSVKENFTALSELKLYPNPAFDKLWVISPILIKEREAYITDLKGKKILSIDRELIPHQPFELQINHLPPGMYFLNYTSKRKSGNVKFIVQ